MLAARSRPSLMKRSKKSLTLMTLLAWRGILKALLYRSARRDHQKSYKTKEIGYDLRYQKIAASQEMDRDQMSNFQSTDASEYNKEKLFRAQLKTRPFNNGYYVSHLLMLTLLSHRDQDYCCKVQQVACSMNTGFSNYHWKLFVEKLVSCEKMIQIRVGDIIPRMILHHP